MKSTYLRGVFASLIALSGAAQASLTMNVYVGAGNGGVAGVKTAIAAGTPTASTTATLIDYWDGSGGSGNYSNNFAFPGGAVNNFGVNFTGFLTVGTAGTYEFRSLADDGVELAIDGLTLFTDSGYHPPGYLGSSMVLSAGQHTFSFIYFEGGGGATVELEARAAGGTYSLLGSGTDLTTSTSTVPEPATLGLVGLSLLAAGLVRRKR